MKQYLSKNLLTFALPALLLTFTLVADKANFGGNWGLNEGKSELGEFGGRFAPKKIKVEQKGDAITIAKTTAGFQGGEDVTRTETLTFDGKPVESTYAGGFGNAKRKASLKWAGDEKSFVIAYTTNFEGQNGPIEITGTETWTLGADGKSFILETKSTSPQGEFVTKAAYDKQ